MKTSDVVVIGGGLAGMMAAVFSAMVIKSTAKDSLTGMREFLQGRWKGIRPVLLGRTLRETEMTRSIYELSMNVTGGEPK